MIKLPIVLFTMSAIVAAASDQQSLAFPDEKIGLPPLSLAEMGKPTPLIIIGAAREWFRDVSPSVAPEKKLVSSMPIVSPKSEVDPKMLKVPDSSTDYK